MPAQKPSTIKPFKSMQLFGFSGPRRTDDAGALERYVRAQAGTEANSSTSATPCVIDGDLRGSAPERRTGPDRRADRATPIWLASPVTWPADPAAAVAVAYRRWGRAFLDRLHGRFALAVIDRRSNVVLLAVDRFGIESLAYTIVGEGIVFGSTCGSVARFPGVRTSRCATRRCSTIS